MVKLISFIGLIIILSSCSNFNKKEEVAPVSKRTVMAIFAHPDDEIVISPLLAKYAKAGVNIYLVFVTDGSKGVTAHANIPAGDSLAKVRSKEALCVTKTLGINSPIFLDFMDGDLALNENIYAIDDKIDSLLTKYKPNVVITFGPDGEYGHSDHRMVSNIVTEVFQKEASAAVEQLIYYGFPKESINKKLELNTNVGNWFHENWKTTQKRFLTHRIPFNEEDLELAYQASSCHKSQYTSKTIDDLFSIMGQTNGYIYLRSWNGSKAVKDNIFD